MIVPINSISIIMINYDNNIDNADNYCRHGCVDMISPINSIIIVIIKLAYEARGPEGPALRTLGLLLADGTPTVGGGKTF